MPKRVVMLTLALGLMLPAGMAEARNRAMHEPAHREHGIRHYGHDARHHALERMRRKHDHRHIYRDRRPRRHMRSM
jgi:hypothetical protein